LARKAASPDGDPRFGELEARLGYRFSAHDDLEKALTHASAGKRPADQSHYERLEFLGDRVLGLAIADLLHRRFPAASEGELALRLNALVKGRTLAAIADELGLHEFIRTGSDLKGLTGKSLQSVRADVLEAVIAAIYLDGGLDAASAFIRRHWTGRLDDDSGARRDSKTALQEWSHSRRLGTPNYRETGRQGPDHDPLFTVAVSVKDRDECTGAGRSKRAAEQDAARAMLVREGVWQDAETTP